MLCFPGTLVFIQDDRRIFVELTGTIDPHIALTVCGASVFRYHDGGLIGLQHMETVQFFMQVVIKNPQISVCTLDHPIRHHLLGDVDIIPQEFLTDPI